MMTHLRKGLRGRRQRRHGAMLVLIAITLPLVVIMAAFALDVAWMQLVRTELRTATDAASRAGAKTLSLEQTVADARAAAKQAALSNNVAGQPLRLRNSEIEFGIGRQSTNTSRFKFSAGGTLLNAVRVTGNRTAASLDGPVGLFLGRVMGVSTFEPTQTATSTQLDRDICLVVDRSGSMMEKVKGSGLAGPTCSPPGKNSRWTALHVAVNGFIDELNRTPQQEQCALVTYSSAGSECGITFTTSDINVDLTMSYSPILSEMNRLSSQPVKGRTAISAGLDNGNRVLTGSRIRPFALKSMVLMTDGLHNTGREPILSAREAAAKNLIINTVTFSDDADINRMKAVAEATGGRHFHAPNAKALEDIFREIASTLPVLTTE
jgi:Ca-activated chloride channel homolog